MIAKGIDDVIVEPARKHLIPGYDAVKSNALKSGALAVTISGAGPSMISFLKTSKNGNQVADSMGAGFKESRIKSRTFVCHPSRGVKGSSHKVKVEVIYLVYMITSFIFCLYSRRQTSFSVYLRGKNTAPIHKFLVEVQYQYLRP